MLDQLRPTSTGLDSLPAWFLKLGAPVFVSLLLTFLIFLSLNASFHNSGRLPGYLQFLKFLYQNLTPTTDQYLLLQYWAA